MNSGFGVGDVNFVFDFDLDFEEPGETGVNNLQLIKGS